MFLDNQWDTLFKSVFQQRFAHEQHSNMALRSLSVPLGFSQSFMKRFTKEGFGHQAPVE